MAVESFVGISSPNLKNLIKKRYIARLFKGISTRPLGIEGHTGVGKTETIRQTAEELTRELPAIANRDYPTHPVTAEINKRVKAGTFEVTATPVNLSVVEPPDFQGMPMVERDSKGVLRTVYGRPPLLPDVDEFALFFLDEINRSGRDVRNALLTMLQEERINNHRLGHYTMLIAAMNPANNDEGTTYEVQEFDAAFAGRLALCKFDANVKDFTDYMKGKWGASNPMVQFIIHHSDVIDFAGKTRCNPRGLEACLRALEVEGYDGNVFDVAAAEIGTEPAGVLRSFLSDPETVKAVDVIARYTTDQQMQLKVKRCVAEDRTDFLGKLNNGVATAFAEDIKKHDGAIRPEVVTNIRAYLESLDNEFCFGWFISLNNALSGNDDKYREACRVVYGNDKNSKLWTMLAAEKKAREKGKPQRVDGDKDGKKSK